MEASSIKVGDVCKVWTNIDGEALYEVCKVEADWIHFRNHARPGEQLSKMKRIEFARLFQKVN